MNDLVSITLGSAPEASQTVIEPSRSASFLSLISGFRDEALKSAFVSTVRNGLAGYRVVHRPRALRLHQVFNELNLARWLISTELEGKPHSIPEPVLITRSGILLSGFADWHSAACAGQPEIDCIEFAVNEDEALQIILSLHRPRAAWNDFIRTDLALKQVPYFESKALANQVTGGRHKGMATLPKAERIDVREEIANLAGVSSRTVGNVKNILKKAHPQLIDGLRNGTISINRALKLCQHEWSRQLEELAYFLGERLSRKTTCEFVDRQRLEKLTVDTGVVLAKLQQVEAAKPGSVEIRPGTREKTVILMGKAHLSDLAR